MNDSHDCILSASVNADKEIRHAQHDSTRFHCCASELPIRRADFWSYMKHAETLCQRCTLYRLLSSYRNRLADSDSRDQVSPVRLHVSRVSENKQMITALEFHLVHEIVFDVIN